MPTTHWASLGFVHDNVIDYIPHRMLAREPAAANFPSQVLLPLAPVLPKLSGIQYPAHDATAEERAAFEQELHDVKSLMDNPREARKPEVQARLRALLRAEIVADL